MFVDRGRDRDDEEVAIGEIGKFGREAQTFRFVQLFLADFQRRVATGFERFDAHRVDVETDDRTFLAEFHSQRQADIAEADDAHEGGTTRDSGMKLGRVWSCDRRVSSQLSSLGGCER